MVVLPVDRSLIPLHHFLRARGLRALRTSNHLPQGILLGHYDWRSLADHCIHLP